LRQVDGLRRAARAGFRTLIALEQRWVTALQRGDVATSNAILADTYVDTDEGGFSLTI